MGRCDYKGVKSWRRTVHGARVELGVSTPFALCIKTLTSSAAFPVWMSGDHRETRKWCEKNNHQSKHCTAVSNNTSLSPLTEPKKQKAQALPLHRAPAQTARSARLL